MPDANALSILEAWKNVKLEGFLNDLQAQTGTIADAQKEALLARKNLADRTREFKRQAPETQLEGIRGLLKSYQSQIDALTTRAKQAETIVLDAHARLGQVRDPSPLLDILREQISEEMGLSSEKSMHISGPSVMNLSSGIQSPKHAQLL